VPIAGYDPSVMSDPSPPERNLELRASDAEREQAVQVLHAAMSDGRLPVDELEGRVQSAYTVRTRRELELLIADVSVRPLAEGLVPAPSATADQLAVREGPGGSRWVIAVLSGADRRGRWRIGKRCTVVNALGGSGIDLCDAELSDPVTELNVYSFMGGGEVRVPHGVAVHVSDFALMGGNDVQLGEEVVPDGGPVIHLRLVSIMSGVGVRRGRRPSKEELRRERELRRAKRRGELEQ
jgi:hypothetical protein